MTHLKLGHDFNQRVIREFRFKKCDSFNFELKLRTYKKFVDHIYKFNIRKINLVYNDCEITMVTKNKLMVKNKSDIWKNIFIILT